MFRRSYIPRSFYRNRRRLYKTLRKNRRLSYNLRKYRDSIQQGLGPIGSDASKTFWGTDYAHADDVQKLRRKTLRFRGAGDYRDIFKYGARAIGGIAGGAMGYMQGGFGGLSGGAASGWNKGAEFSKYMGWGDYAKANQIVTGGANSQISVNQTDLSGDIYVARTEFVQNIVASGTTTSGFELSAFGLNPGLEATFPWLSQIAQNFTLFEFQGLMFQYKPLFSEEAGSSNNLGKVIMATQYDPEASDFRTSIEMENYDYANSCKPSEGMIHGVETKNGQQALNMQYIRTGTTTRDLIFTDIGKFQIATEGIPLGTATSVIIGELWVTYYVKLSRAELYNSMLGYAIDQDVLGGTSSAAALWVATTFTKETNNIGVTLSNVSATALTITFPVNISLGSYQVFLLFSSGATVFTTQTIASISNYSNCESWVPGSFLPGTTGNMQRAPVTQTACTDNSRIALVAWITIESPGLLQASFRVNVSAALSATTTWQCYITQTNSLASLALA